MALENQRILKGLLGIFLFAFGMSGCGSGGSTGQVTDLPGFRLSLSANALSVGVGDAGSPLNVTVIGLNGFSDSVSVNIEGLPAGATSVPASPFLLQVGENQQVTLSIPTDAGAGQFPVIFHAASGSLSHESKLALTIVPCLTGGTEVEIQAALDSVYGFADLCPGAKFIVHGPIRMGSSFPSGNRIFTAGYPTELTRKGLIMVANHADAWPTDATPESMGYAVIAAHGDGIRIQNIQLDGNRRNNTVKPLSALVAISGRGNLIDGVYGTDPLGAPALSAASWECADLTLTHNVIEKAGSHIQADAAVPAEWGDGIQVLCDRAYVAYNEIRDATDVGLMNFGGRDSIFEFNRIENFKSSAFGGLGADPEDANALPGWPNVEMDFRGTVMRNNTVETCCGQHIHVALSVGVHLWCNDAVLDDTTCAYGMGLAFQDNKATGLFGYGLYMGGMKDAIVSGNIVTMTPLSWINCYVPDQNFYVLDHATGTFQAGYATRTPLHWPCLGPIGPDEAAIMQQQSPVTSSIYNDISPRGSAHMNSGGPE
jgi:hypothetical protein